MGKKTDFKHSWLVEFVFLKSEISFPVIDFDGKLSSCFYIYKNLAIIFDPGIFLKTVLYQTCVV